MIEYSASDALAKAKRSESEQFFDIKQRIMADIKSAFNKGKTFVHHFVDNHYEHLFHPISKWLEELGYTVTYEEEIDYNLNFTGYHKFIIDWSEPTNER